MKTLRVDDLERGQLVTVIRGKAYERDRIDGDGGIATVVTRDGSFGGDVLRVLLVETPFVVLQPLATRTGHRSKNLYGDRAMSLDTREWTFATVSDEYARALYGGEIPALP